ncbi:MAG: NAD-dependent alcohol dehydrogenase [Spirochaetae bacterium HGW-Spirochaetae-3]|jgi:alcohol dehydrogenase|nr:MAG: NAD-dependent alcohol dehydrogenase [Spirochaetae bacterium HGW-Spirochaetae-3]
MSTNNSDPFSFFCPTKLVFGPGTTKGAGDIVAGMGIKSVLLVSGSGATRRSPGFAVLMAALDRAGVAYTIFDKVTPDPVAELVAEAAEAIRAGGLEAVVAYGGGSPIDCGKSAALAAANGVGILEFLYKRAAPNEPALPIIAVPTTAGTGSEMSSAAVTTDRANDRKLGYSIESFFPRAAIVDPENHLSMPPRVTAATGMDALTHAVESYLSLAANHVSDAVNLKCVSLIGAALPKAYADGGDLEARSAMAIAGATAGAAFSQTGLGMVHGFAHPVGARFGVAHGDANATILPYVMAALARTAAPRMRDLAAALGACRPDAPAEAGAAAFVEAIVELKSKLGIAESLSDAGIRPEDAKELLPDALGYRMRARSPRAMTDDELGRLLDAAIAGDLKAAAL